MDDGDIRVQSSYARLDVTELLCVDEVNFVQNNSIAEESVDELEEKHAGQERERQREGSKVESRRRKRRGIHLLLGLRALTRSVIKMSGYMAGVWDSH